MRLITGGDVFPELPFLLLPLVLGQVHVEEVGRLKVKSSPEGLAARNDCNGTNARYVDMKTSAFDRAAAMETAETIGGRSKLSSPDSKHWGPRQRLSIRGSIRFESFSNPFAVC